MALQADLVLKMSDEKMAWYPFLKQPVEPIETTLFSGYPVGHARASEPILVVSTWQSFNHLFSNWNRLLSEISASLRFQLPIHATLLAARSLHRAEEAEKEL